MISPAEMVTNPARCPRCSGQLYRELADEYCCLACGEYVFVARRRLTATAHPTTRPRGLDESGEVGGHQHHGRRLRHPASRPRVPP
jgi:hypothetical protein